MRFDNKVNITDDDSGNEFAGLFRESRYRQSSGFDEFAGLSWERHRKMTLPPAPKQSRSGDTRTLPTLALASGPLDRAAVAPKRSSSKTTLPTGSVSVDDAEHVASNVAYEADSDSEIEGFDGFIGLSWERHRKMTPPLAPKGNSGSSSGSNFGSGSDSGPGSRVLDSSSDFGPSFGRSRTPLVLAPKQSHLAPLTVVPLSDEIVSFAPGQSRFICDAVYDTDSDSEVEGFDGLTGVSWERPSKITTLATSGSGSGSGTGTGSGSSSGFGSGCTHTTPALPQSQTDKTAADLRQGKLQDRGKASVSLSRSTFKHFLSQISVVLKGQGAGDKGRGHRLLPPL